ncbi:hypothetical protein D6C76_00855 [Aureobasidium pullulans]|uniref:SAP domain-containing protein n=2 Tax=Aureobasidium pullulans TaxID=5580 RepID=A0A4T0FC04_AURPU|nr:hypothetical protein D6D22_07717 [Aureobasidium pullulans]TIA85617.1 hypothetical protein D6C76_00855 [Aureobasidium pullulans]
MIGIVEGLFVHKRLLSIDPNENTIANQRDKMAEYTKMKNADLEALLKERNLPHTGKKAELVKRLQDSDSQTTDGAAPAASKNEDEIDWDDEPAAAAAKEATTDAAAVAIAAGGQGQPPNPQAVPNQQVDIDPSQTNDLTVTQPADDASTAPAATADATVPSEAQPEEPAKPAVDFTSGLAKTTLDQEIEKRKARAKKFGMNEDEDEALKALERAKRFGNTEMPGKLNEALPERRERSERKRGAPADAEQSANKKRDNAEVKRENNDSRRGGRRDGGRRGGAPQAKAPAAAASAPAKKEKPQISEADRAKAEARKARFA